MGRFLTKLIGEDSNGSDRLVLDIHEPFVYETTAGQEIHVPVGFRTDFASVPRLFWRIFPPTGRYRKAAVIHDYLYRMGAFTRRRADEIFWEAMGDLGVRCCRRWCIWAAVRVFGRRAYQSER